MRGRRARPGQSDEIDENFWAQAAADQAAGRSGDDGDESGWLIFSYTFADHG